VRYGGQGAAFAIGDERRYLVEGRAATLPTDHNLIILDAGTGAILHRLDLLGGTVRAAAPDLVSTNSLRPGVAFNGSPPMYMVGGADGYLYLLDLSADVTDPACPESMLLASWSMGATVGELSAADLDGDGSAEVFVPHQDGEVVVFDTPSLAAQLRVADTNCLDPVDVDIIERGDVFCAAWTVRGMQPDGFVVTLYDQRTGARMAARVNTDAHHVTFSNLRLSVGQRYAVEVQAYAGSGSTAQASRSYHSDGAELVDPQEPPKISLSVVPDAFVPGIEATEIIVEMMDPSPLASYRLWIEGEIGVVYEEEDLLNTVHFRSSRMWDGRLAGEILPEGEFRVVLEVEDFSGLVSATSERLLLLAPQEVESADGEIPDAMGDVGEWEEEDATGELGERLDEADVVDAGDGDFGEDTGEELAVPEPLLGDLVAEEWITGCACRVSVKRPNEQVWVALLLLVSLGFVGWWRRSGKK